MDCFFSPFSFFTHQSANICLLRLDDAAVALQKEKNMYKEIENFPMCFKVNCHYVLLHPPASQMAQSFVHCVLFCCFTSLALIPQKTTAQVLIHLHRGDYVAADKCVRESYRCVLSVRLSLTSFRAPCLILCRSTHPL